jgi:hypothetical protein
VGAGCPAPKSYVEEGVFMGEIRSMDGTGDTKIIWDATKKDEVDIAREAFNKLKKKGYSAFEVKKGGDKGTKIDEFDPDAEKLIMTPALQGG